MMQKLARKIAEKLQKDAERSVASGNRKGFIGAQPIPKELRK
ncbi:hypothetical protein SAMN04487969_10480 [Paenibacillus algorifonticola]|uniref:Uncharacterized protein n=1 Tax=Paenibacillus algorifonticola TaxID=684063 RepID=A0A1I2BTS5_9BACL|nr:hypothetical protein [Paenibacillus sp. Leaf72]SFE59536.1 hypothetical protein SAMN04487969_10480 [Paenibacillus algorifonticola]